MEKLDYPKARRYRKHTFFYSMKHPFSNWYYSKFTDDEGVEYNCSEQYMMAAKAKLFGDTDTLKKILDSSHPMEQKELGRQVKNFDSKIWNQKARELVYEGLYLKFKQNEDIYIILEDTAGTLLAEASPYDKIWGIGLSQTNPDRLDRNKWQGKNWLGELLTVLRDNMYKENYC